MVKFKGKKVRKNNSGAQESAAAQSVVGSIKRPTIWSKLPMKKLSRKKKLLLVVMLLLAVIVIVGIMLIVGKEDTSNQSAQEQVPTVNPVLNTALSSEVPGDAAEKVSYYSMLAQGYLDENQLNEALEAALEADSNIQDRSAEGGQTVNSLIARIYVAKNDNAKALEYYQKELDRISGSPDNQEAVEALKARMDALK